MARFTSVMMGIAMRRILLLVLITAAVGVLVQGIVVVPRLLARPSGAQQELRKSPDGGVQAPAPARKGSRQRAIRSRPVSV